MTLKDMSHALKNWPELNHLAIELIQQLEGGWAIKTSTLDARIIVGDARKTLKTWNYQADAWFLDGFSDKAKPAGTAKKKQRLAAMSSCRELKGLGIMRRSMGGVCRQLARLS